MRACSRIRIIKLLIALLVLSACLFSSCTSQDINGAVQSADINSGTDSSSGNASNSDADAPPKLEAPSEFDIKSVPEYSGQAYVAVNGNKPYFSENELTNISFEYYSQLDALGRCGVVYASIGKDLMPTDPRGEISSVKPSGWQVSKYDFVDGKSLYNRCHLIGFQLSGENANRRNLITGTRYMNVDGMLPFENMVADYVREERNHVMFRVTPIFEGDNLIATGVLMEGYSVEDDGEGICFNVFCYNVQPRVSINYADGSNRLAEEDESEPDDSHSGLISSPESEPSDITGKSYILNTNTKKFHRPTCHSVKQMSEANKETYYGSRNELIDRGYIPCKNCNP